MIQATPMVGDTVRVERVVGVVEGAVIRPQPWSLGSLGQQLGPADVSIGANGATVRYALVLWYPGEHTLRMPGPVIVRADGRSDTLAASTVKVRVLSALPADARRSDLPPRPATTSLPLASRTLVPAAALLLGVLLIFGVVALRWRRKGRPARKPPPAESAPPVDTLKAWATAGEYRAALHEWGWILAGRLSRSTDLEEIGRIQKVLDQIGLSSFAPRPTAELAALCAQAERLAG